MFLTPEEISDLTGIKRGRAGKTRGQLQCDHLRRIGVPFFVNAAGEPKVARAFFEGITNKPEQPKKAWQPAALRVA